MPFENKKIHTVVTNLDVKEERERVVQELEQLGKVKEEMAHHTNGAKAIETEFLVAQEKWSGLQQDIGAQQAELERLQTVITEKRNRAADAHNDVTLAERTMADLTKQQKDLQEHMATLADKHSALQKTVELLETNHTCIQQQHEQMKADRATELAGLTNQIATKKAEIILWEQDIAAFKQAGELLQATIISLQTEVTQLKAVALEQQNLAKTAQNNRSIIEQENILKRQELATYCQEKEQPLKEREARLALAEEDLNHRETILTEKRVGLRELKTNLEFQLGKTFPNIII